LTRCMTFGNFILLSNIICERQPVLDTEVYPVVMQASQLIWRSSWWWSYGCCIYNYMCSQYLSQIKLCVKDCQWFRISLMASGALCITWSSLSVTSNPDHDKRHSIHHVIMLVSDLRLSLGTPVPADNNTDRHHITELV
jgi:hypothetical protein